MNMLKRYQAAEKVMPYNAKKLVTNINPKVSFKENEVIVTEQYFYQGEIQERYLVKNIETNKITRRKKKEEKKEPIPLDLHTTLPNKSPDLKWSVYSKDFNIVLKNEKSGKEYQLTTDGNEDHAYGWSYYRGAFMTYLGYNERTSAAWSHDSKKVVIDIMIGKNIGTLTITQVFNNQDTKTPMHPKDYVYHDYFPFEADASLLHQLAVIDIEKKTMTILDKEPFYLNEWGSLSSAVKWDVDDQGFIFIEGDKYYQKKSLWHVNNNLELTEWGYETTDTFFQEMTIHGRMYNDFGFAIHVLKNQKQAIWLSKQVDLGDLYIYDFETKSFAKKITTDDYHVSTLLGVDEEKEVIYFMGSSLECMSDPYYGALCSIKFDGSNFTIHTPQDAMHSISLNMSKGIYIDTYSRCDLAPVTVLGYLDGRESEVLLEANITKLLKAGYILPKRTKITLDDGMTLYGCIILPKDYNENKKYPVIDYCYGGPQTTNTPKKFTAWADIPGREAYGGLEAFAQLGFIGVIIDGRGTPDRGKKMHDISFKNLHGLNGLCDHEPFLRKLALEYKGIDLDRVGIWGNSAGGYMSTRALLEYPDFFKVAVSSAGDHDNQIYNASWAFRYHSRYDVDTYLAQDSAQLVENFKGHLLLCHGLLDDNVHPSQTFRMIQYFNKANKDVDLMVLPDTDHNCPGNVYFMRRRFDYFVRYLMGATPPANFKFSGQK